MENPVSTPQSTPAPFFKARRHDVPLTVAKDPILSSSPAFGTPAYPIASRPAKLVQPFVAPGPVTTATATATTVLPILLPTQILRPLAFRTLTKKHNLTLTSSALQLLATFVGRHCGSGWREEGLAERVLDEVAKAWKRDTGGLIVEDGSDKKLTNVLKNLEQFMSGGRLDTGRLLRSKSGIGGSLSRQNSLDIRPGGGLSREDSQASIGLSALDVWDDAGDEDSTVNGQDIRTHLKIISAFSQPRLMYSTTKKSLEHITAPPSLFPPPSHKTALFRNRYNLVHQRLMRNESFQTPSFSTTQKGSRDIQRSSSSLNTMQQAYKITPIANLLGRPGSSHLLLGLLANAPTGDLALTDLTGSITLDLSSARPVPEDGAWFCPGMIVLVEGIYEEDGSSSTLGGSGGVGGMIGGTFVGTSIGGPPAERRDVTLGISKGEGSIHTSAGSGFGWVDFLGIGSERAVGGPMRNLQRKILGKVNAGDDFDMKNCRTKIAVLGECHLNNPRTVEAIRGILASYSPSGETDDTPLAIVLTGNFVSTASMAGAAAGGGSIEYKEHFDTLASMLSEFPGLLSGTSLIFLPGDNDPWASSFSAGAATAVPRESIPEIFTSRIRRVVATANSGKGKKEGEEHGQVVWASNPTRMSLFGPVEELVLFRDDITGRLRRGAITFSKLDTEDDENNEENGEDVEMSNESPDHPPRRPKNGNQNEQDNEENSEMEIDMAVQEAVSKVPNKTTVTSPSSDTDTHTARKLVKTILDQGHLSPFPLWKRPVLWDYASTLALYPLPTALVLTDADAPPFALTYEGCHVMNPGRILDELYSGGGGGGGRRGMAQWVEYDVRKRKGEVKEVRF